MSDFDTIKARLATHDDQQLLDLWVEHDTEQWTPDAFRVVAEILTERGLRLPKPGGIGAEHIRQARAEAASQQRTEVKARFGRGLCYAFGFLLALPCAVIGALFLYGIAILLHLPEKLHVELVAFGGVGIFLAAGQYISALFIRKYRPQ